MENAREDRAALREMMNGENPGPTAVGGLVISMHNQRTLIQGIQTVFITEFKGMLTENQQALYDEIVPKSGRDRVVPAFRALRLLEDSRFNRGMRPGMSHGFGDSRRGF